jgi:magnesium transporter
MIRTMLHNPKTGETRRGDEGLFSEWLADAESWLWADFNNEALPHEQSLFRETFKLHPLAISDAQRDRHSPKLEVFENCFFLLMQGLSADSSDIDFRTIQIAFFVGDRFLVTRRICESLSLDRVWADVETGNLKLSRGPAYIAYHALRRITDRYTLMIEGLDERLDAIEEEMFERPNDSLLETLIGCGRNLKRLKRILTYHQDILTHLSRGDHPFMEKRTRHEFKDVFEHTERLASLTNLYKELADDLMNGYISVTSHHLNRIMKVLTVVTVIFLPLMLMVGIYGMNFENMPELKMEHAYFVLLGVMGCIAGCLLLVFRKMRWL